MYGFKRPRELTRNRLGTHKLYVSWLASERALTLSSPRKLMVWSLISVGMVFHEQAAMSEACCAMYAWK